MKKDRTPESVLNKLLELIPERKIYALDSIFHPVKSQKQRDASKSLNTEAAQLHSAYYKNVSEEPRFCYIAHEKKDGVLAARALEKSLKGRLGVQVVYGPQINEKELSAHIDPRRLQEEGIEAGYVKKKSIPVWHTLASAIAGFGTAAGTVMEIAKSLDAGVLFQDLLGSFGLWTYMGVMLLFVVSICALILQHRKNTRELLTELNAKLNEISDEEFLDFLARFADDTLRIPDCNPAHADAPVYICAMQPYNFRQKHILRAFWESLETKQLWFIFIDTPEVNQQYLLTASPKRSLRAYRMDPLSKQDKKRIANTTYGEHASLRPDSDGGIAKFGADYLCRFQLREREPVADAEHLNEKIREFCREYHYQTDIKLIIRLIAELSSNYMIDFSCRRGWEHLFDYHNEDAETAALDQEITSRLQLDNYTMKKLIPEIQHSFGNDFDQIVASHSSSEMTSEYTQWCLIKALRCHADKQEDRYLAISDALLAEWEYAEDVDSGVWTGLLIKTLQVFYRDGVLWFLPSVVHNLLRVCENRSNLPNRIFSLPIVLDVARANLLLNVNTDADAATGLDVIRDHYRVTAQAAGELNSSFQADSNQGFPSDFELLQLSNPERQRYYNTLVFLKEQAVLDYYDYIFDMYCASLLLAGEDIRFCYKELYNNTLYDKYAKKQRIASPTSETYIRIILGRLLELLGSLYSAAFPTIREAIDDLKAILNDESTGDDAQKILLLLVKFDVIGAVTLNFIACMIARLDDSETVPNDVYLGLGNYLIGMTFLTYHENTQDSFYNHDFIHLVQLATNYAHPCGAVLGYLYFCDSRYKSEASQKTIRQYIYAHKAEFLESLQQLTHALKLSDLESFAVFINCTGSLTEEEQLQLFSTLREILMTKYTDAPQSDALTELLTLYIDKRSSDSFAQDTPENNISKVLALSPDSIMLLYKMYLRLYRKQYLPLCPRITDALLQSSVTTAIIIVVDYLFHSEDQESEDYEQTLRKVLCHLQHSTLAHRIETLQYIERFLSYCFKQREADTPAYRWITKEDLDTLIVKVFNRRNELHIIQSRDYLNPRTWNKYGLGLLLRYLMTTASLPARNSEPRYAQLSDSDKTAYIIANCQALPPFVEKDGNRCYNNAYIDMLNVFINDGEIQNKVDEQAYLRKLASDAPGIINSMALVSNSVKEDMCAMVTEYVGMIDRK